MPMPYKKDEIEWEPIVAAAIKNHRNGSWELRPFPCLGPWWTTEMMSVAAVRWVGNLVRFRSIRKRFYYECDPVSNEVRLSKLRERNMDPEVKARRQKLLKMNRSRDPEETKRRDAIQFQRHKERIYAYRNARRRSDSNYRLGCNLRTYMYQHLGEKTKYPNYSRMEDLNGCSFADLKKHLESQFTPEMTWENYGAYWEVDHILPVTAFDMTDELQQRKCFHFSNLQPLEKGENRSKKDKILIAA